MSEPKRKPKYLQILQILLDEISDLQPGSRITGVTSLAKRFAVARATAERVLNEMARKGYVRQVPGSGTYVADRRIRKIAILAFDRQSSHGSFYDLLARALTREIEGQGHNVDILWRDADHGPSLQSVHAADADAYAAVGIMNAPYLENVASLGKPMIAVDYRPMSLRIDSVTVASMRAGYLGTRSLLVAGCSRLCYIGHTRSTGEEEADASAQRVGFERAHAESGIAVAAERIITKPYEQQVAAAQTLLADSNPPDGILCFDEEPASRIRDLAIAMGKRVPEDVAILSCGGNRKIVSTFIVDPNEMGRVAANLLSERLGWTDLPARDYEIWPDYHDGGTMPLAATDYIRSVLKSPAKPIHTRTTPPEPTRL